MDNIESRVSRLERRATIWRFATCAVLCLVMGVGAAQDSSDVRGEHNREMLRQIKEYRAREAAAATQKVADDEVYYAFAKAFLDADMEASLKNALSGRSFVLHDDADAIQLLATAVHNVGLLSLGEGGKASCITMHAGMPGAALQMRDRLNRERISISLDRDGNPTIRLRDGDGKVIWLAPQK